MTEKKLPINRKEHKALKDYVAVAPKDTGIYIYPTE
jgi:hypothetical protein